MGDFFNKIKQMWNTPDDEYDYDDKYDENDEEDVKADKKEKKETTNQFAEDDYNDEPVTNMYSVPDMTMPEVPDYAPVSPVPDYNRNKVMNISATTKLQVVVFRPDRFSDDTRTIADELIKQHTIVLNLENTDKDNSRRIIDFMSGAAYATGGKIKRVAASTFLVIPSSVQMTGADLMAQLQSNGVIV